MPGTPSSGSAYGPRSRRLLELVLDSTATAGPTGFHHVPRHEHSSLAALKDALYVRARLNDHGVGAKVRGQVVPLTFVREQGGAARWKHNSIGESDERDEHVENGAGGKPAEHEAAERVVGKGGVDVCGAAVVGADVPVAVLRFLPFGPGHKDGPKGISRQWGGIALLEPLNEHVVAHRRKLAPRPPWLGAPAVALQLNNLARTLVVLGQAAGLWRPLATSSERGRRQPDHGFDDRAQATLF